MSPQYQAPGIYIEEVESGARPIQAVGTSTAGFIGVAPDTSASVNEAVAINNWSQFEGLFCQASPKAVATPKPDKPAPVAEKPEKPVSTNLSHAVFGFFLNGGRRCYVVNIGEAGDIQEGLKALETIDEIAIVAAPGITDAGSHDAVLSHCEAKRDRIAILDTPMEFNQINKFTIVEAVDGNGGKNGLRPRTSDRGYGAAYMPWIKTSDPFNPKTIVAVPPSGHLAGIYARTDATRGVHKAPANETIRGALGVTYQVSHEEQEALNPEGINCIRYFPRGGIRVWGARTLADGSSEWRYINVRRLFSMIEESIAISTRWVVFEPNDQTLWKSIRRDVGAFLTLLWRDGALMGGTPQEAFFVKCDEETNPPEVIDAGQVVVVIGIAPVKPAEFIIFKIGQHAGGVEKSNA